MSNARELAELGGAYATGGYPHFKNRIINGAMVIDQRNAGASVTPAEGAYTLDRWKWRCSQASKVTIQQSTTAPAGFVNSALITVGASANVTVGSSDYFFFQQAIEGYNVADFGFGAAGASSITFSFWVRSSVTGTFGGSVQNSGSGRSYPFNYTISSANTWEQKTVTVAGDTSGTWLTTNGIGLQLRLNLGSGSSFLGTANTWASADYQGATGNTNWIATNSATFYITGVQLEKGSTATAYDYRPYGTELQLCQRYYQYLDTLRYSGSYDSTTALKQLAVPFLTQMRSAPTATFSYSYGNGASSSTAVATEFTPTTVWDLRSINVASGVMAATTALSAEL